jgi:hypothetical protein
MSRHTSRPSPSAQTSRADCIASALRNSEMPTNWPTPLRVRSSSAAVTPSASSAAA